jgi:SAM-dependent methyltransferase
LFFGAANVPPARHSARVKARRAFYTDFVNTTLEQSKYPGDQSVFDELFLAEDRHFWFRARNTIIAAALDRATRSLRPDYRVLEIGCGTGNVLRILEKHAGFQRVTGMDLFAGGLPYARRRTRCALIQADMHHPPFDTFFDVIGMFDVIEHLADAELALRRVHSLLNTGGKLLLTVPAHMSLWSYADRFAGHYRRYASSELTDLLSSAGFHIEYLTAYMAAIFPLMLLRRQLINRFSRKAQEMENQKHLFFRELHPVPLVNGFLRWVLEREATVVRAGYTIPFGTSLLAIASKPGQGPST